MNQDPTTPEQPQIDELPPPTGTLFLMMLFLMLIAGMWLGVFFQFIGR